MRTTSLDRDVESKFEPDTLILVPAKPIEGVNPVIVGAPLDPPHDEGLVLVTEPALVMTSIGLS